MGSTLRRIAALLFPFQAKLLFDVFDSADGHLSAMGRHDRGLAIQGHVYVGTFTPLAIELCALALQLPLELGAVHELRVHINIYHVKMRLRWGRRSLSARMRFLLPTLRPTTPRTKTCPRGPRLS